MRRALASFAARLRRNRSGLAAVEFALTAPIILTVFLGGVEVANFAITKMRISQIALHVADNASRIGTDSLLTNPQISESQINDLFVGANLQASTLDLLQHGRVILSSLEPIADPNTTGLYKIHWQRCYGEKNFASRYGLQGDTDLPSMGPADRAVTAPDGSAVMYVEIAYDYQPLVSARFAPGLVIHDVAAMVVRNDRDFDGNGGTGVYNNESVTPSSCS